MSLLRKIALGAIDVMVKPTGARMSDIERSARASGRELNDDFYERKSRYQDIRSQYEENKKRCNEYDD